VAHKRITYQCGFCGERKYREKDKPTYIYPVPVPRLVGQTADNRVGALACRKCAKKTIAQQRRLKLIAGPPVGRYPIISGGNDGNTAREHD